MDIQTLRQEEPIPGKERDWQAEFENASLYNGRRKVTKRRLTDDIYGDDDFKLETSDQLGKSQRKSSQQQQKQIPFKERKNSQQYEMDSNNEQRKESKGKIDEQQFHVELQNVFGRIKQCTTQIKEKIKTQKEFNQSIIDINVDPTEPLDIGSQENGQEVSMILKPEHQQNELSMIRHHEHTSKNLGKSVLLSPINQLFHEDLSFQDHKNDTVDQIDAHFQNEEADQTITINKLKFEKVLTDLETRHQAEKDGLKNVCLVYQKVIKGLISKIKLLQDQVFRKERELLQLDKLCIIQEKLQHENDHLRMENLTLSNKVELMKSLMMEFDTQRLEEENEDKFLVEQLLIENTQLKKMLHIPETLGMEEINMISERLHHSEEQVLNQPVLSDLNESVIHLEHMQSMPNEVQMMVEQRIEEKDEERKMKDQMRKLAEEEILKELKMAEEFFKRNNKFEQTQKGYNFYEDRDDDLEERDTSPPQVSGANDEEQKQQEEGTHGKSPPRRQISWGEMLELQNKQQNEEDQL